MASLGLAPRDNYALIGRYDDAIYKLANGMYVNRCTYTSGTTTGTMYTYI